MKCPRCQNTDLAYFYLGSKGYYCRKCISFKRMLIEDELSPKDYLISDDSYEYELNYELTKAQKKISNECAKSIDDIDVLLCCSCGCGKTELVMESISKYLKMGKKVCYAIARKEVVLELSIRFKNTFKKAKVIKVCEGYTDELIGDLIVCTTHQLYRYPKTFDLLILDEVDAFPFKGNEVLENIALNSVVGHIIYSTATLDETINKFINKRAYKRLSLYQRPHGYPLIVPKIKYLPKFMIFIDLYQYLKHSNHQCIIFVESKKICRYLYFGLSKLFKTTYVYSDLENRDKNILAFKNKEYDFMIATTVLERGVTISGVNVVIINILKNVFDKSSIIQMTGRVGRSFKYPIGDAIIYTSYINEEAIKAKKEIEYANEMSLL